MKDMTNVANTMLSEEEKAELEASGASHISASSSVDPHPNGRSAQPAGRPSSTASASAAVPGHLSASLVHHASSEDRTSTPSPPTPVSTSPSPTTPPPHSKKRSKLTPEQRAKLEAHEKERKQALEVRVRMLTKKLAERLRPFVEAKNPGGAGDEETAAWERRMRREADDLKFESFGVELLHAIGTVYVTKASNFLKSRKFLGM
jgi:X-domain of DnaJ-containing